MTVTKRYYSTTLGDHLVDTGKPVRTVIRGLGELIAAVIAAALWFGVFPWLQLHVPVDGSAING